MAGIGKRLGALTQRKPKALVRLADKRLLDHVLDTFIGVEAGHPVEYVFILGYLGDQIKEHMKAAHPDKAVTYFVQEELLGQSHAIYLARDVISGPVLLTYCDTVNEVDYSFLASESLEGVAFVQEVDDPRRHGVAVVGPDNLVKKLVEKPDSTENRLALTGVYHFSEGKELMRAIETQLERGTTIKNEFYLADAINILIERGMRIRTERVVRWLDAGTPEALIETNAALLMGAAFSSTGMAASRSNVLIPPLYVHESAHVENSILGPNVSIGKNCSIKGSILRDTIVDDDSTVEHANLHASLLGRNSCVKDQSRQTIVADHETLDLYSAFKPVD
jgi:glucose-1-phosphate thymidylyltransferase